MTTPPPTPATGKQYITDPAARDRVLTCAFCGETYPEGTPTHKHAALTAHIRTCPDHPIGKENRALRAQRDQLLAACKAARRIIVAAVESACSGRAKELINPNDHAAVKEIDAAIAPTERTLP